MSPHSSLQLDILTIQQTWVNCVIQQEDWVPCEYSQALLELTLKQSVAWRTISQTKINICWDLSCSRITLLLCDRLDQPDNPEYFNNSQPHNQPATHITRFLYWNRSLMLPSPECKVKYVCFIRNLKCPFRKFRTFLNLQKHGNFILWELDIEILR